MTAKLQPSQWVQERADDVFECLLPHWSEEQIFAWLKERYDAAHESYQDFLSRPDS